MKHKKGEKQFFKNVFASSFFKTDNHRKQRIFNDIASFFFFLKKIQYGDLKIPLHTKIQ